MDWRPSVRLSVCLDTRRMLSVTHQGAARDAAVRVSRGRTYSLHEAYADYVTMKSNCKRQYWHKFCSESFHRDTDWRCSVQISWNVADGKLVKSCVVYLTKVSVAFFKLLLLRGSRPKSAWASPQQCAHSAPGFIQIGSFWAVLFVRVLARKCSIFRLNWD